MDKECGVMDHTAGGVGSVLVCTLSHLGSVSAVAARSPSMILTFFSLTV